MRKSLTLATLAAGLTLASTASAQVAITRTPPNLVNYSSPSLPFVRNL